MGKKKKKKKKKKPKKKDISMIDPKEVMMLNELRTIQEDSEEHTPALRSVRRPLRTKITSSLSPRDQNALQSSPRNPYNQRSSQGKEKKAPTPPLVNIL